MFYSLQLFLHACLVKSSDLMLGVVAEICWVLANIALVIATTLRDLEQRREISHGDILPHRYFMLAKPSCLCSYDWCVMLTRKTVAISHVLYHCLVNYICLHLSTLLVCYKPLLAKNPVLSMITTRASKPEPKTFHKCPPYLPICGISPPLQVNFSCATFKPSNY